MEGETVIEQPLIALVTGITGQDGSYLAEQLLNDGWMVFGVMRRASVFTTERIDHIFDHPRLMMRHGDVTDIAGITHILHEIRALNPSKLHVFHLAAQSHVGVSFETPLYTAQVSGIGTINVLEAIRAAGLEHTARFYQASTSELYGKVVETPQSETTPFYPRSPYGVAKLYAYWIVKNYRESYGMHASNGVLYNHESQRRGKTFVTRKITLGVAQIAKQLNDPCGGGAKLTPITLGNLDAKRDWGYAPDFVTGMRAMLDQPVPDDYVLATGECHSVREFVELAFQEIGCEVKWRGEGVEEEGFIERNGEQQIVVRVSERYFRPAEVDLLLGDPSKAKRVLGWEPRVKFPELVQRMVRHDLKHAL
jgi:GDPmannose 4,6-dehydratase